MLMYLLNILSEANFQRASEHSSTLRIKNVLYQSFVYLLMYKDLNIKLSTHYTFLEWLSSGMLKAKYSKDK